MTEKEKSSKKSKARGAATAAGKRVRKSPVARTQKPAAVKPAKKKEEEQVEAGDGHEQEVDGEAKLRKSAHRAVAEKSGAIADKLAEQAANGNVVSAKFLVDLITKKSAPVKRHSTINSRFIGDMEREPEYVETPLERKTE